MEWVCGGVGGGAGGGWLHPGWRNACVMLHMYHFNIAGQT